MISTLRRNVARILLLVLLCCPQVFAQNRTLIVRDSQGNAVPFALFVGERSGRHLLSDNHGVLTVQPSDFDGSEIFTLQSSFYQPLQLNADELPQDEVVLSYKTLMTGTVKVYPNGYAEKVAKMVSDNFAKNSAANYAAKVTWLSTVECNGKYRQFMGYRGLMASLGFTTTSDPLYWEDKNVRYWFPLTVMKSDALAAGSDEILEAESVITNDLRTRYVNKEDDPWIGKRALELYSPLNPRQLRNFDYFIADDYTTPEGDVVVLHFQNKPGTFPRKTKIVGQGYIHCMKKDGRPIKVVTENLEDHYSFSPRTKTADHPSLTQHLVTVDYSICAGKIVTTSITVQIDWVGVNTEEGHYYAFGQQRRRNPLVNNERDYRHITLTDHVLLDKDKAATIKANAWAQGQYNFVLTAPFDKALWERTALTGIDRDRLFRDLNANGCSLWQQAGKNAMFVPEPAPLDPTFLPRIVAQYGSEEHYFEVMKARTLSYHNIGRNAIYPLLYGKKY